MVYRQDIKGYWESNVKNVLKLQVQINPWYSTNQALIEEIVYILITYFANLSRKTAQNQEYVDLYTKWTALKSAKCYKMYIW